MRVSQLTEAQEAEEAAALGGKLERNRTAQVAVASKTRNNAFASPRVAQPLRCERIMAQASSDGAAFDLRLGQEVERETTASVRSADGTPPFLLAQYSIPKSPPAALRARRQARARGLQARRWQACGLVGTPRLQRARSPASRIASQQGGPPGAVCRTARSACGARELRARGEAQSLRPGGAVRPFTVPLATPSRSSARARAAIEFFR